MKTHGGQGKKCKIMVGSVEVEVDAELLEQAAKEAAEKAPKDQQLESRETGI